MEKKKINIAVIGGGASGLCVMRYIKENGNKLTGIVFEQADSIGGTWYYTECVGKDKFGLPVNTSMYKNLRTNLPKEAMEFPGFPFKECKESYVHRSVVFDYLNEYADKYNIRNHIKLNHYVKKISRDADKWNVIATDLMQNKEQHYEFDVVMICNGHNSAPSFPKIKGMDTFTGCSIHSHDYRTPEQFKNQIVLIIGAGPSGIDIAYELCYLADKIIWSHHSNRIDSNIFPNNVLQKPDIDRINGNEITFNDGAKLSEVNSIIYCTGYNFSYPFLDESCEIFVDENYVSPLYKQLINISQPTMCFIGIPKYVPQFPLFDIQTRYYLKLLSGGFPDKEIMYQELKLSEKLKMGSNLPKRKYHALKENEYKIYFDDFTIETGLKPIPELYFNLHNEAVPFIFNGFKKFREYRFKTRYYLKYLTEGFPQKEKMIENLKLFEKQKTELNLPKKRYHAIAEEDHKKYFDDLVKESDVENIPEIFFKLHSLATKRIFSDFLNFRKNIYKVTNEDEVEIYKLV